MVFLLILFRLNLIRSTHQVTEEEIVKATDKNEASSKAKLLRETAYELSKNIFYDVYVFNLIISNLNLLFSFLFYPKQQFHPIESYVSGISFKS